MLPIAEVVDWEALLEVVWTASLAGLGVTAAFGLSILGGTLAYDRGRDGRVPEAVLFAVLGAVAMVAVLAGVIVGVVVMVDK